MKIDPYNHERRYKEWKEKVLIEGIPEISKENSKIILQYLEDMEHGLNVSAKSPKGARSYIRLNTIRDKMKFFSIKFKEHYDLDSVTEVTENQIILFFSKMRKGEILKRENSMLKEFMKIL